MEAEELAAECEVEAAEAEELAAECDEEAAEAEEVAADFETEPVAEEPAEAVAVAECEDEAALAPEPDEAAAEVDADAEELYGGAPYATPVSAVLALITLGWLVKLETLLAPAVGCTVTLVPELAGVVLAT